MEKWYYIWFVICVLVGKYFGLICYIFVFFVGSYKEVLIIILDFYFFIYKKRDKEKLWIDKIKDMFYNDMG